MILLLQLSQFFSFIPLLSALPPSPSSISHPPQFMSMGCTYKFFGFSISYTILNCPLTILCLSILLLIPCTFSPILLLPTDNPPCDLHFCDSVPVLVVCLVYFCFVLFFRFSCCEFVVILLFIFFIIFFFLDKSL